MAHAAPPPPGQARRLRVIGIAIVVVLAAVLVYVFAIVKHSGSDRADTASLSSTSTGSVLTPTPTPTPTADPVLDPTTIDQVARGIKIDVLNGTPIVGLQDTVGAQLAALGWRTGSFTWASDKTQEKTFVYYSDPLNEDVARGLVLAIGAGDIRLVSADTFPGASLTIVLGADYPTATPAP